MRTLRLSLVGAVILVLFGTVAVVVGAQDDDGSADPAAGLPLVVTGNEICTVVDRGTSATPHVLVRGSDSRVRDQLLECTYTMTDARVTGTSRGTFNDDCFDDEGGSGCVFWGTGEVVGPDGRWQCSYTGTGDPYGQHDGLVSGICRGAEAYEGLTYMTQSAVSFYGEADFGGGTNTYGLIYAGDPPPLAVPATE
jgi:hypothetical protein